MRRLSVGCRNYEEDHQSYSSRFSSSPFSSLRYPTRLSSGLLRAAASGQAAVAPSIAAINSRRLIVTGMCPSCARAA